MTKELQDLAWSCLPKAFKEEVKKRYKGCLFTANKYAKVEADLLGEFFGHHNLTSDAEGEEDEMLYVSRKKLQYFYKSLRKVGENHAAFALQSLFGSRCLPDELNEDNFAKSEPKPAEPKFKAGDKVKDISSPHDDGIYKVDDIKKSSDGFIYHIQGLIGKSNVKESDLRPYTEPKENPNPSNSGELKQQEADKQFDNILKDSFSKERRLNIAAMMAQAILTRIDDTPQVIAEVAFRHADALIAESERRIK